MSFRYRIGGEIGAIKGFKETRQRECFMLNSVDEISNDDKIR